MKLWCMFLSSRTANESVIDIVNIDLFSQELSTWYSGV